MASRLCHSFAQVNDILPTMIAKTQEKHKNPFAMAFFLVNNLFLSYYIGQLFIDFLTSSNKVRLCDIYFSRCSFCSHSICIDFLSECFAFAFNENSFNLQ